MARRVKALVRLGCVLWICVGAAHCRDRLPSPPSDEALIQEFREKRQDFEQLAQMFREDMLEGITCDVSLSPIFHGPTLPRQRREAYTPMLSRIRPRHLGSFKDGTIEVALYSWGIITAAISLKGIANVPDTRGLFVRDRLDGMPPSEHFSHSVYRHVDGQWFLYVRNTGDRTGFGLKEQ